MTTVVQRRRWGLVISRILAGILIAAVAFLGCADARVPGDLDVLGLAEACVVSAPSRDVLVSPGLISLEDGAALDGVDFEVQVDGLDYEIGVANSGVNPGDVYDVQAEMSFDFGLPLNLSDPGEWPVAIVVDTAEEGRLSIDAILYSVGGVRYRSGSAFELVVASNCG